MKKPNRIAQKVDTARQRAQTKPAPIASRRDATKSALREATEPPTRSDLYGEEIASMDRGDGSEEYLHKRGEAFTLVTQVNCFRVGNAWRNVPEHLQIHPEKSLFQVEEEMRALPPARLKVIEHAERIERDAVLDWLFDVVISSVVPAEFMEAFRPCQPKFDRVRLLALQDEVSATTALLNLCSAKIAEHVGPGVADPLNDLEDGVQVLVRERSRALSLAAQAVEREATRFNLRGK